MNVLSSWLIDYYLQASVVLLATSVGVCLLRQPARRLALFWATAIGLLALAVLVALPGWPRSVRLTKVGSDPSTAARAEATEPESATLSWLTLRDLAGEAAPEPIARATPPLADPDPDPDPVPRTLAQPVGQPVLHARSLATESTGVAWQPMLLSVFLTSSGVMALWLVLGAVQTMLLRRRSEPAPAGLQALLQGVIAETARTPVLGLSRRIRQPVALGLLRPAILLPAPLVHEVAEEELKAALAHEWAHIRRGDLWLLALMRLLWVVLFAHPLYWWLRSRVRLDQETLADASAAGNGAVDYATRLLHWARLGCERRSALAALALWERPSQLKRRLRLLLDPRFHVEKDCSTRWRLGMVLASALGVSILSLVTLRPAEAETGNRPSAFGDQPAQPAADGRQPAADLRYSWKEGETYVYAVQIEAEFDQYFETHSGNSIYQVRSAEADAFTLRQRGQLVSHRRPKPAMFGPGMARLLTPSVTAWASGWPGLQDSELKVDAAGKLLRLTSRASLPYGLGSLPRLVIEPLPRDGKETWETTRETTVGEVAIQKADDFAGPPFGPMGLQRRTFGPTGFRPESFGPIGFRDRFGAPSDAQPAKTMYHADEKVTYRLGIVDDERADITKKYELRTADTIGDEPRLLLAGEGSLSFDRKAGVMKGLEFKGTLRQSTANLTHRIPLRVTYRLVDDAEKERVLNPPPPPKVEPKPLTGAELSQALADLKDGDGFKKRAAADKLAKAVADEARREEVAKALEALVIDQDLFTRAAGAKALAVWATKDSVRLLIKLVDDEQHSVRWAVFEVLGQLKDERAADWAAEALAQRLRSPDRVFAGRALQALGPAAEREVVKYLKESEWTVRLEVCQILKVIGTPESKSALEEAAKDANGLVVHAAREALKAIENRTDTNDNVTQPTP